ncbi:MAG: helix-turn-helix domain-containing protein [Nanoarchaeota archaeon]
MVNHKMVHPQEVEVYIVLPAIRRELSRCLKKRGVEQKEIAKKLGVTDAAISQYLSDKRGQAEIDFPKDMAPEFEREAKALMDGVPMRNILQKILRLVMDRNFTCKLHRKVCGTVPAGCAICFDDPSQDKPNVKVKT